jgi:16S rRNA processing protein RimM
VKSIGRITKTHGFEGAVVVRTEGGITREPEEGEPVFVIIDGIPVPFFTRQAFAPTNQTLIISFDDYLTPESVARLKGCEIRTADETDPGDDLQSLTGYTLTDNNSDFSGVITSVIQHPGQSLVSVLTSHGEHLIPIHPDLIISVDEEKRIIKMSLPDGLAAIND